MKFRGKHSIRLGCALALALAAPSALASNDGAIDGIYSCTVTLAGVAQNAFLAVNGKSDGKTVYVIAAATPNPQAIGGYGIGLVSGGTFSGATSVGKKFGFALGFASNDADDADYETVSLVGKAGVKSPAGTLANAEFDCKSIW